MQNKVLKASKLNRIYSSIGLDSPESLYIKSIFSEISWQEFLGIVRM